MICDKNSLLLVPSLLEVNFSLLPVRHVEVGGAWVREVKDGEIGKGKIGEWEGTIEDGNGRGR